MKKLYRFVPLVRPKLPSLAGGHHTHDAVPCIRSKFGQRLHAVHDEIPRLCLGFFPARVDVCAFAVDGDQVFRAGISFRCGARSGVL